MSGPRGSDQQRRTLLLLSDSHAPRHWRSIPRALEEPLRRADLVLHAGDVCRPDVLDDLAAAAKVPILAVLGNNDGPDVARWGPDGVPQRRQFEVAGVRFAMVHDAGARVGRARRLRRWFPGADVVVYGHSHIPYEAVEDGLHLINPGSAGDRRTQPATTYGVVAVAHGRVVTAQIMPLS